MIQQFFLGFLGFGAGIIVSGGITGLMIALSIIPRYASLTHTADQVLLYEDASCLGIVLGNLFQLFSLSLPLGTPFLIVFGTFSGIFLGGWILALSELADIVPIFSRRLRFYRGIPALILSLAFGKTIGNLLFYYFRWQ